MIEDIIMFICGIALIVILLQDPSLIVAGIALIAMAAVMVVNSIVKARKGNVDLNWPLIIISLAFVFLLTGVWFIADSAVEGVGEAVQSLTML